jgi:molybdopterin-guanine dinucleotide biosynthesis protein A
MSCNPISTNAENRLLGVVLCGGQSVRMGTDKGLIVSQESTWVKDTVDRLKHLNIPVVVSINETQQELYEKVFRSEKLILDSIDAHGPLRGLLSVHSKYPSYDLIVMACDLPDLKQETLIYLKCVYEEKVGEHDFLVFGNKGQLEPLVGVYSSEGLSKVFKLFIGGKLEKHSMKYVLEHSNTYVTELNPEQTKEFRNYNYKEDLSN